MKRTLIYSLVTSWLSATTLLFLLGCSSGGAPPVSIQAPVGTLIAVSAPDVNGLVTVTGSAGAVNAGATVIVSNPPRGNTTARMWSIPWIKSAFAQGGNQACSLAGNDGSFCVQLPASECDTLGIAQQDTEACSNEITVQVPGAACGGVGQPGIACPQPSSTCPGNCPTGGGAAPFSTSLGGVWTSGFCCTDTAFGQFTGTDTLSVTQNNSAMSFTDDQGGSFSGTISGMNFTWSGSTPGTPVVAESGTWVFSDENNFTKSTSYSRDDGSGGGNCNGIGAKTPLTTPSPPSCP